MNNIRQIRVYCGKIIKNVLYILGLFEIEFLIVFSLLLLSSFLCFILVRYVIPEKENFIDHNVFLFFKPLISPVNTNIADLISFLGTGSFLIPCYFLIVYSLVRKNLVRHACMIATTAITGLLLGWLLKFIFHRSRPPEHLVTGAGGYSFPSGHALGGFILSGVLIYLVWISGKSYFQKWISSICIFLFGLSIGLSRIYLHVHYATDVLGSLFIAALWLAFLHILFRFLFQHEMLQKQNKREEVFFPVNYHLNN